jgi:hypothetical protein
VDLGITRRKIEDLPSDGGKIVDTLAGALLRTFVRLTELDQAIGRLGRRVAALEGSQRRVGPAASEEPPAQPNKQDSGSGIDVFGAPVYMPGPKRRRGRPAGVRDSYQRVRRSNGPDRSSGAVLVLDPDIDAG